MSYKNTNMPTQDRHFLALCTPLPFPIVVNNLGSAKRDTPLCALFLISKWLFPSSVSCIIIEHRMHSSQWWRHQLITNCISVTVLSIMATEVIVAFKKVNTNWSLLKLSLYAWSKEERHIDVLRFCPFFSAPPPPSQPSLKPQTHTQFVNHQTENLSEKRKKLVIWAFYSLFLETSR